MHSASSLYYIISDAIELEKERVYLRNKYFRTCIPKYIGNT